MEIKTGPGTKPGGGTNVLRFNAQLGAGKDARSETWLPFRKNANATAVIPATVDGNHWFSRVASFGGFDPGLL